MIMLHKLHVACWVFVMFLLAIEATDSGTNTADQNERKARAWHHHSLPGPQMLLQQHQQAPVSTSQPGDTSLQQSPNQLQQSDPNNLNRNFEDTDKPAMPAASEQDFMSRHFGYLNVHRFDPNFPYYDQNLYPRFPNPQLSQHAPRFGPGYRKDKYGHGYGYSCKQGDDCDEVRAANQLAAAQPPPQMAHHHHPHNHGLPFGNNYPELPPFPSMPSFSGMSSFSPYGGQFGQPPARFNDPQAPPMMPMPSMYPSRFYQGRYLHDEEHNSKGETVNNQKGIATNNNNKGYAANSNTNPAGAQANNKQKGIPVNINYKGVPANNLPKGDQTTNDRALHEGSQRQGRPEDSQKTIDDSDFSR